MFDLSLAANKIIEMTLDGRLTIVWLTLLCLAVAVVYEATARKS